jgi:hypothetical protein
MPDPKQDEKNAKDAHTDDDDCEPFGDSTQGTGDVDK